jgi:hypothetical protein
MNEWLSPAGVSAIVGTCTLLFAIFIAWQTNRIHTKTDELVIHTNSLTDKLMEKTDTVARAEGVKEGIAQGVTSDSTVVIAAIMDAAADKLAAKLALAIKGG